MKILFPPSSLDFLYKFTLPENVNGYQPIFGRGLTARVLDGIPSILYTGFKRVSGTPDQFVLLESPIPTTGNVTSTKSYGDIPPSTSSYIGVRYKSVYGLGLVGNRLYVTSGDEYEASYPTAASIGSMDWTNDKFDKRGRVGLNVFGVNQSCKMLRGSIEKTPEWFKLYANKPLVSIGGSYFSVVATGPASMGPSIKVFDETPITTQGPAKYVNALDLMSYPFTNNPPPSGLPRCYRTPDYVQDYGDDNFPPSVDSWPGYWTWADQFWQAGTWIDTPNTNSILVFANMAVNKTWYGNGTLNWTNAKHTCYVIDPARLALVALGQSKPYEIQPISMDDWEFPNISYPLPGSKDESQRMVIGVTQLDSRLYIAVKGSPVTVYVYDIPQL